MKINVKRLSDDLKKLKEYYLRHPSNDGIKTDLATFYALLDLYENVSGIKVEDEDIFLRPDRIHKMMNDKAYRDCDRFCGYLDEYLYSWYTLFDNYCEELEKVEVTDVPFLSCIRRYSEKDLKDILLGYFSMYGNKEYEIAKKYLEEGRIQTGILLESGDGMYIGSSIIKSGYIVTPREDINSYTGSILAHELGHAIDRELFIFSQSKRMPFFNDTFLEVPSAFFEVGFYDYLLKNKIDIDGARIQMNDSMLKISDSYYPIHSLMKEKSNGEITNIDLAGDVILKDGKRIELRDELLYGLGYYTAFCMHTLADGNYKEYMKDFYKFVMTRGEASPKESIECLGIDFDTYIDGKIITPKARENTIALKKRFNL